jgi:uncharacterized protein YciI
LPLLLLSLILAAASPTVAAETSGELFVVHFSTGPAWNEALAPGEQAGFTEHSANLKRLRAEGRILFGARYDEYGMLFVRAASAKAAAALFADDPGVQSGIFEYRVAALKVFYPWQTPAAASR